MTSGVRPTMHTHQKDEPQTGKSEHATFKQRNLKKRNRILQSKKLQAHFQPLLDPGCCYGCKLVNYTVAG